jgi:tetratricopeptide (TPR) repeat protein
MIENESNKEVFFSFQPQVLKNEWNFINAAIDPEAELPMSVQDYFDRGNAKVEQLDYAGAIAYFSKAIEIEPENSMAYYHRGSAKIHIFDSKGAIADLKKAVLIPLLMRQVMIHRSCAQYKLD